LSSQNTKFQKANTKFQINPNTEIRNTKQNQNTNQLSAVSRKHAYPNCRSRESGNLLNKPCLNHIHEIRFTRKPEDFISPLLAGYQPSAVSNPLRIDKNIILFIYELSYNGSVRSFITSQTWHLLILNTKIYLLFGCSINAKLLLFYRIYY